MDGRLQLRASVPLESYNARKSLTAIRLCRGGVAALGVALIAGAMAANQSWLDRHFLPSFLLPRDWYVRLETTVRATIACVGVGLMVLARRYRHDGRSAGRPLARPLAIAVAAALALAASEFVLRRAARRPTAWMVNGEPLPRADPHLGWVLAESRTGRAVVGGRTIEYAVDASGYRVRHIDEPVDPRRPTVVFIGESVMLGDGLNWDESVPSQVGAMLGIQSANLAVPGYSNDQAYLRLERELPRFREPVAVVSLFMTTLFGRNLYTDRTHLGAGLVWMPATRSSRLMSLIRFLVPYRKDTTVESAVGVTRDVLRATAALARARGAVPLIVVPHIGHEAMSEMSLRRRVVDASGAPYVFVEIDPAWHVPWDRHPDARAAHVIAQAIAARLANESVQKVSSQ
jgi:hypothetical protein